MDSRSSWAQPYGLTAKTGLIVKHAQKMIKANENTSMLKPTIKDFRKTTKNCFVGTTVSSPGAQWSKEMEDRRKINPTA